MNSIKNKFVVLVSIAFCFSMFLPTNIVLGEASTYTPLAPLEGLSSGDNVPVGKDTNQENGLTIYVKQLYKWGVALTSGLAVIMIMWGGVEYMTSAGGGGIEEAKKRISAAIAGLLLALGSYIILQTINRDLVNVHFDLQEIKVDVTVPQYVGMARNGGYVTNDVGDPDLSSGPGKSLSEAWGSQEAKGMEGYTVDQARQTYYAPGETHSDSNTDAGLGSYGRLVEGTPTTVGSAASVYYPAGTLVQVNGIKYVIDDNNLVKQSDGTYKPANNVLTNGSTIDIFTHDTHTANTTTTHNSMQVLYVPDAPVNGTEISNIRNHPENYTK